MTILKRIANVRYNKCDLCKEDIDEYEDMFNFQQDIVHPDDREKCIFLFCSQCVQSDQVDWAYSKPKLERQ